MTHYLRRYIDHRVQQNHSFATRSILWPPTISTSTSFTGPSEKSNKSHLIDDHGVLRDFKSNVQGTVIRTRLRSGLFICANLLTAFVFALFTYLVAITFS